MKFLVDGNTMDDGLWRRIGKTLWSQTFTLIVMACTWWWSSIEEYLVIVLSRCLHDDAIEMYLLCEVVILCLRCNDIRFVLNSLCPLLWHDDDNVLISHIKVVLEGYSHAILNEIMTLSIQGVSLLWPKLSYYC